MDDFLLTLGALTLGGSAAILLLSLASRSTRSLYGARWRCWAWLLLCLRLAVPFPLLPQGQREAAPIQLPTFSDSIIYNRALAAENNLPLKVRAGRRPARPAVRGARFLLPTPAVSRTHPGMSLSPCPSPNWLGHCGW